ncbi:hypothetical protein LOZ86_16475 [Pectobacterium parvum]|uniref:hypothetical protein n=1 Tax=Pectobacterium parvum TaxID=2778550 RepID=UPI001E5D7604|nr:hypothetical protein [Pectobacterium parvum]UFK38505.1 hypothetical protein LOZ86_16475 [Pectobacterium parvum]GKW43280.1 hypothetical protein PEC301879_31380 [Pectobacterium carotovorum subsp. carotovorum]
MPKLLMRLFGVSSHVEMIQRLHEAGIKDIEVTDRGGLVVNNAHEGMAEERADAKRIVAEDTEEIRNQTSAG